jgi:hypothetical protein
MQIATNVTRKLRAPRVKYLLFAGILVEIAGAKSIFS